MRKFWLISSFSLITILLFNLTTLCDANGNGVYYGEYRTYPTGDTLVELPYMHGGPIDPNMKWIAECNDYEALVGIRDGSADFLKLETMWCKQMFPNKSATNNSGSSSSYPYYEHCLYRNASQQDFYCFDGTAPSFNTFMTALYEDDESFSVNVDVVRKRHAGSGFKCCGLPEGYQINYQDCEFRYTHDTFWEYFDNKYFLVKCPDKHVMTGIGWITNPYDEDRHWDWIHCCPVNYFGTSPPTEGSQQQLATLASQVRYQSGGGVRRPAFDEPQNILLHSSSSSVNGKSASSSTQQQQEQAATAVRGFLRQTPATTPVASSAASSSLLPMPQKQRDAISSILLSAAQSSSSAFSPLSPPPPKFMRALTADVP